MHYFFITGTSKGIGFAIAQLLLEHENNFIIGMSRSRKINHERYKHVTVDFSSVGAILPLMDAIFEFKGDAESVTLINNAGSLGEVGYMGELNSSSLPAIYNINLVAPAILTNEFIGRYRGLDIEKTILNVSSGAGGYPVDGWSGYCATKSALNMLSQVIAKEQEIRESGIKIFAVAPGVVDTEMQEQIRGSGSQQFSGVQKFIHLKESKALSSADSAASKIIQILKSPDQYHDVQQDVRDL